MNILLILTLCTQFYHLSTKLSKGISGVNNIQINVIVEELTNKKGNHCDAPHPNIT